MIDGPATARVARAVLLGALLGVSCHCSTVHELRPACRPGACALTPERAYLWQTSSGGDDVHIIDVEAREVVARLIVGPNPHGIATPRDQRIVYVSLEANDEPRGELIGIDSRTLARVFRTEVGPEPHAIAATPDGRFIYVPCRDEHYWVVDAATGHVVTRIRTGGRPHNTSISSDGRRAYLSPLGDSGTLTVVDITAGHRVIGTIPFTSSLRPPALSADGSRLFQHVDGLNGFEVASTAERRRTSTIEHSRELGWFSFHDELGWLSFDGLARCHGLAIRPDQREIWSACGEGVTVHALDGTRYPEVSWIEMPDDAYWLTFSPDSGHAFVAITAQWQVVMVDATSKRIVARFPVGPEPKRNLAVVPPAL